MTLKEFRTFKNSTDVAQLQTVLMFLKFLYLLTTGLGILNLNAQFVMLPTACNVNNHFIMVRYAMRKSNILLMMVSYKNSALNANSGFKRNLVIPNGCTVDVPTNSVSSVDNIGASKNAINTKMEMDSVTYKR